MEVTFGGEGTASSPFGPVLCKELGTSRPDPIMNWRWRQESPRAVMTAFLGRAELLLGPYLGGKPELEGTMHPQGAAAAPPYQTDR